MAGRRSEERGAASVELAVTFPVVLLLVMTLIQAALWFYARSIALGAAPVALWAGQTDAALRWLSEGIEVAEHHGAEMWRLTLQQLLRGAIVSAGGDDPGPDDIGIADRIGPTPYDMLPTFAPTLLDARTLQRVETGRSGWNAAEVLRISAMRHARDRSGDVVGRLHQAATLAERQGARLWSGRIEAVLAEVVSATENDLSFATGKRA